MCCWCIWLGVFESETCGYDDDCLCHCDVPQFTGKERDAETGLDYFGARYMSAAQGRFTSPDSTSYSKMRNPQSWNLYAYSFNNPLRYTDPEGHEVQAANCTTEGACNKVREGI